MGAVLIALIFVLPYFAIFQSASLPAWSLIQAPLWVSLQIALGASLVAVLLGVLGVIACEGARRGRLWVAALLGLPSGISVLVLGLGFWLAYSQWVDPFEGSLGAIIALQATLFLPLVFRNLWSAARSAQTHQLDAAQSLGASAWRAFYVVEWPRLRPVLLATTAMVIGASLGEVAAVSLFYSEKIIPLPLLISRAMAQYHFEEAQGVGALLLVLAAASFLGAFYVSGVSDERSKN
jgi:ABC-type Fe3+ transport system permease subunit